MALPVQEVFQQNKVRPDLTFVILVGQRKQPAFRPSLYVTKKPRVGRCLFSSAILYLSVSIYLYICMYKLYIYTHIFVCMYEFFWMCVQT